MIDLHSHTNESDGTLSPAQLIEEAVRAGVTTLGITDHDTFKGYDQAGPHAATAMCAWWPDCKNLASISRSQRPKRAAAE